MSLAIVQLVTRVRRRGGVWRSGVVVDIDGIVGLTMFHGM
jgi:hypothetical protein